MLTREVFDKARDLDCEQVVTHLSGAVFKRGMTNCPFPDHEDKDASFSLFKKKNKWTCFGCEKSGSTIDFVMRYKGVDQNEAVEILVQTFGIDLAPHGGIKRVDKILAPVAKRQPAANLQAVSHICEAQRTKNAKWLRSCAANRGADDYFFERGFTDDTIAKFHLGYDKEAHAAVIPYSTDFDYYTAKLLCPPPDDSGHRKPKNTEWGDAKLFNEAALDGTGVVFIVESQTCAISIMQEGGQALGLGGTSYTRMLLHEIEKRGGCKDIVFVLAFDNDPQGKKAKAEFAPKLKAAGIRFIEYSVQAGEKDPNDLLKLEHEQLRTNIQKAIEEAKKVEHTAPKQTDRAAEVKALLAEDIPDKFAVFSDKYISALAYAKEHLTAEYSIFKMKAKAAKVAMQDLNETVIQHLKRNRKANAEGEPSLDLVGIDLGGAVAPKGWTITIENGVRKLVVTRDAEHEIIACPDAVVVTKRLKSVDDGNERYEVSFFKDNAWHKIIATAMQIFSRSMILEFSNRGLAVTSESAKDLVGYLSQYEKRNREYLPIKKSVARVGWVGASQFFPFATDEEVVFEDGIGASVFYNLSEQGDFELWKEMMRKLRENPFARFITSASFASPLLIKMGVRPFTIHIWYDSASGKSAVLKAAISVWGNPEKIMATAFTTVVGLEQKAGMLNNLPLGIDEKQAADENKTPLSKIIYMLGEGEGKTRGARGGGNQEKVTWHNVVIITGEEPITSSTTMDGVQTRTFELHERPVDDMDFASSVHVLAERNFGGAGIRFMQEVCDNLKKEPDFLARKYTEAHETLKIRGYKGVHSEYTAAVIVADYLAETLIFGTESDIAWQESFANGIEIFNHNTEQLHSDNIQSAYNMVLGWIASNEARFSENQANMPSFGKKVDGGEYRVSYYILANCLEKALTEAGYNADKITRGFFEKGYITPYRDGKKRKKHPVTFNGVPKTPMYKFDFKKKDRPPMQGRFDDLEPVKEEDLPF